MDEMGKETSLAPPRAHRSTSFLHPRVYGLMMALAGWLVMSIWIFSAVGSTDYLLTIISGFICVAVVGLPFILSRVGRAGKAQLPFRAWKVRDFETWTGRLRGSQAAAEILLPIAAVAFGMTAFGIVLHLVELSVT